MTRPERNSPESYLFGVSRRDLWWPAALAVALLAFNKLVVHDGDSFFGTVLMVGFAIGIGLVHAVRFARRRLLG